MGCAAVAIGGSAEFIDPKNSGWAEVFRISQAGTIGMDEVELLGGTDYFWRGILGAHVSSWRIEAGCRSCFHATVNMVAAKVIMFTVI